MREVKEIAEKLDQNYSKLMKRIENFDREKRQFSIIANLLFNPECSNEYLKGAISTLIAIFIDERELYKEIMKSFIELEVFIEKRYFE